MKKLICMIFAILMLSACYAEEETKPENEKDLMPSHEENALENEAFSDDITEFEEKAPSGNNMDMEKSVLVNAEREIYYTDWFGEMKERGISVSLQNISFEDDYHWNGEFLLKNTENEFIIPVSGVYSDGGRTVMFGTFNFINESTIAYCGKEKIICFNTYNFETDDFSPELPESEDGEIWINSAGYSGNNNQYIITLTKINCPSKEKGETFICFYDAEGKLLDKKEVDIRGSLEREGMFHPYFLNETEVFEYEGEKFLLADYKFTSLESDKEYRAEIYTSAKNEWNGIEIYLFYESDDYENRKYMAFLSEYGIITDCFAFKEDNLSVVYNEEEERSFFYDGKKAVYYSDYFAMTLELDFENETHKVIYNPTDKHTGGTGIESPDGRFSICGFGETSGGDAFGSHYAIRNNETGKYLYIGESGGMWGGYGDMGFLKNGDFYRYSTDGLIIMDPENGEIIFDINEKMPFGYDEKTESERGLLTFRRDPENFTFIIVYYEYENGCESVDVENEFGGWHYEWDFNYKIGFLDAEGNLLASYDTGMPFFSNHFGINPVTMYYTPKELTITVEGGKAKSGFIGVFDLETHEFKAKPLEK